MSFSKDGPLLPGDLPRGRGRCSLAASLARSLAASHLQSPSHCRSRKSIHFHPDPLPPSPAGEPLSLFLSAPPSLPPCWQRGLAAAFIENRRDVDSHKRKERSHARSPGREGAASKATLHPSFIFRWISECVDTHECTLALEGSLLKES